MLKRLTCVVVVLACVGIAYGAANKIRYFTPEPVQVAESVAALGPDADPDGMAILNYASGADKTIVQIIVSDMTPNLTYSVRLTDGVSGDIVVPDAFTTDEEGHGPFHQEFPGVDISDRDIELFVGTTASGEVWSQLQDPDNLPSPYASPSLDTTSRAADDVQFDAGQKTTAIRWWGIWCNKLPLAHDFRVRFYYDNNGEPGDVVADSEQNITATMPEPPAEPPVTVCGTAPPEGELEFMFEAILPVSFVAPTAGTYWVEVVGRAQANNPVFMWSNATGGPDGDGVGAQWVSGPDYWLTTDIPDRAFELIGETDTTELRATGINPG